MAAIFLAIAVLLATNGSWLMLIAFALLVPVSFLWVFFQEWRKRRNDFG